MNLILEFMNAPDWINWIMFAVGMGITGMYFMLSWYKEKQRSVKL